MGSIIVRCSHVPAARPSPTAHRAVATDDTPRRRLGYLRELSERLQNLLIVEDRSRRRSLYFKLCVHFLDLRRLLFDTRGELRNGRLELLFQLRDGRLLLCASRF